jgi:hypothetical protein
VDEGHYLMDFYEKGDNSWDNFGGDNNLESSSFLFTANNALAPGALHDERRKQGVCVPL